jgi:hypothetical protein
MKELRKVDRPMSLFMIPVETARWNMVVLTIDSMPMAIRHLRMKPTGTANTKKMPTER